MIIDSGFETPDGLECSKLVEDEIHLTWRPEGWKNATPTNYTGVEQGIFEAGADALLNILRKQGYGIIRELPCITTSP